jgi:hypothetical protein
MIIVKKFEYEKMKKERPEMPVIIFKAEHPIVNPKETKKTIRDSFTYIASNAIKIVNKRF